MQVAALDGRTIAVRRLWMPWRLRKRPINTHNADPSFVFDSANDPGEFLFGLVAWLAFVLVGGIILTAALFASEALLPLLLLVPILVAARLLWVLPWVVEVSSGGTVLGHQKVRGWRDSEQRIHEIATAYMQGSDPFNSVKNL